MAEDLVHCGICMKLVEGRDPRSLPCLDVFCLECISVSYKHAGEQMKCPKCQQTCLISDGSVENLPRYHQAQAEPSCTLNENYPRRKNTMMPKQMPNIKSCSVCDIGDLITSVCFTCRQSMCESCSDGHKSRSTYKEHLCIPVSPSQVKSLLCEYHDLLFDAYCESCWCPVCKCCQMTDHMHHNIRDFVKRADQIQKPGEINLSGQPHGGADHTDVIEDIQKQFNKHVQIIQSEIQSHKTRLVEQITQQEKSLRLQLQYHQQVMNRQFEQIKVFNKINPEAIDHVKRKVRSLRAPLNGVLDIAVNNAEDTIEKLTHNTTPEGMKNPYTYKFVPGTKEVSVGQLTFEKMSPSDNKHQVSPPADNCLWSKSCPDQVRNVTCFPNGDIILVCRAQDKASMILYSPSGDEKRLPFQISDMLWTNVVAVHQGTSTLAYADMFRKVGLWTSHPKHWIHTIISRDHEVNTMAFLSNGDLIQGSTTIPFFLHRYNPDGKKIWKRKTTHPCHCLTTDTGNNIIVSGENEINKYDQKGERLRSSTLDVKPRSICSDSRGCILVVDLLEQAVLMLSPDLELIKSITRIEEAKATHIALHSDRYLVVGSSNSVCVLNVDKLSQSANSDAE